MNLTVVLVAVTSIAVLLLLLVVASSARMVQQYEQGIVFRFGRLLYTALDVAVGKLEARLRRSHDRRRVHHGRHQPTSVATATAPLAAALVTDPGAPQHTTTNPHEHTSHEQPGDGHHWVHQRGGRGHIVREKEHSGEPMTIDQILSEMELVGHDFTLFVAAASARSSMVYRRKGYDYGAIRLMCAGTSSHLGPALTGWPLCRGSHVLRLPAARCRPRRAGRWSCRAR